MDLKDWYPDTWMEFACMIVSDGMGFMARTLPQILELHTKLASRAAAHLALVMDNLKRTTWLAGALLDPCASEAQAAAVTLERHLIAIAHAHQTPFVTCLTTDIRYMQQLHLLATADPPHLLWQSQGAHKDLFVFLALRLLTKSSTVSAHMPGGSGIVRGREACT